MKTLTVASRAGLIKPSPTLAISAKANAMKADGIDVVVFGAGEPDFPTPEPICEAAISAIESGFTKYTPTSGIKELREAIAAKVCRDNGIDVTAENIVVSCGAKHCLYNATQMLVDPGDEVILFSPYWMTYYDQILLAGGTPVTVKTQAENNFIPSMDALKEKISGRTKAIILNTPCNPTGAVFPRQTLKEIAQIALRHDLWVICDEIYEKLVYHGAEHVSLASLGREIAERTVMVGGCSKSFAMTGWRIGYAAAPLQVAKAIAAFQDSVTSNATAFAQKGALEAFKMDRESIEKMRSEFSERCDLMKAELEQIPKLGVPRPQGAFYFLVDVRAYLGGELSDDCDLAAHLLENAHVATVPGSVFDAPGFIRLSYTASKNDIQKGIKRIGEALSNLST